MNRRHRHCGACLTLPDSGTRRWYVPAEPTWSLVLMGECLLMMAAPLVMGSPTAARPSGCSRRLRPGGRTCRHRAGAGSMSGYQSASVQLICGVSCSNRAGTGSAARVKICICLGLVGVRTGMAARLRVI